MTSSSSSNSSSSSLSPKSSNQSTLGMTVPSSSSSSSSLASVPTTQHQQQNQISIIDLLTGECIHEFLFNGVVYELKSNGDLLCVSSYNRIDAFDLNSESFEHRFSIDTCCSYVSKSTGMVINTFTLSNRWLAFSDNKVSFFFIFNFVI
jgi:hypothetical protein